MKKAKMILDRFLHPPKWVICTVPVASFSALIFIFASNREEIVVAYPFFFAIGIFSRYPACLLASIGRVGQTVKSKFMEAKQNDSKGIVYGIRRVGI